MLHFLHHIRLDLTQFQHVLGQVRALRTAAADHDNGCVRIVNSAIYTLQKFQEQMKGEAEKAGFTSEEDIAEWITKSRRELHDLLQEGIHDIKTENTRPFSDAMSDIRSERKNAEHSKS